MTAWIAASILGPRKGRFYYDEEGKRHANDFPGHSVALKVLGVMILWFGWCVSIAFVVLVPSSGWQPTDTHCSFS